MTADRWVDPLAVALQTIVDLCDAPYFDAARRWKIRDVAQAALNPPPDPDDVLFRQNDDRHPCGHDRQGDDGWLNCRVCAADDRGQR
jgi:hypothetical protein